MSAGFEEVFHTADFGAFEAGLSRQLGRPPLAHARLLRRHALRRRLQEARCRQEPVPIAAQMAACGLPACGETARAYRALFGELPRQTLAG